MANTTYATVAELKARVSLQTTDAAKDALAQQILNTAAWYVDQYTRRPPQSADGTWPEAFSATGAGVTRLYTDYQDGVIPIDDALSVTAILRGTAAVTSAYWQGLPLNGLPIQRIALRVDAIISMANNSLWYGYPLEGAGLGQIAITGTWGYCTQANRPAIVKEATLMQAERLYERQGLNPEKLMQALTNPYRVIDPLVMQLLAPLVRAKVAVL